MRATMIVAFGTAFAAPLLASAFSFDTFYARDLGSLQSREPQFHMAREWDDLTRRDVEYLDRRDDAYTYVARQLYDLERREESLRKFARELRLVCHVEGSEDEREEKAFFKKLESDKKKEKKEKEEKKAKAKKEKEEKEEVEKKEKAKPSPKPATKKEAEKQPNTKGSSQHFQG
ncbi:uncharacterized protein FIBRA_01862 [Fibroporia radiculosa]|uniref:Uncharacterized protein n=1 Tax=Fibroporia radiculosa TaxID=599839 RepID=J4G180_9APHY|nr:uncharacterized protein FIBRA_01862 [Fibroporia radiculosa]CCL99838.1 predicted protein [Fibroporia radiculosa]